MPSLRRLHLVIKECDMFYLSKVDRLLNIGGRLQLETLELGALLLISYDSTIYGVTVVGNVLPFSGRRQC